MPTVGRSWIVALCCWSVAPGLASAGEIPFAASATIASPDGVASSRPADMDGDGDLDVLYYTNGASPEAAWAENTAGDGSAWPIQHSIVSMPAVFSDAVAEADVDGDGDLDVFVVQSADLQWYENQNGLGTSWSGGVSVGPSLILPVAADFDRDGDMDVGVEGLALAVGWFENDADGSSWASSWLIEFVSGHTHLAAEDLDGDGDLDFLASRSSSVVWYENTAGDGSTWALPVTVTSSVPDVREFAVADLDGDGDLDVVTVSIGDDEVSWFENTAGDASAWALEADIATGLTDPESVTVADLDEDGDLDVAIGDANSAEWYENTSGDASTWSAARVLSAGTDGADYVRLADLDSDGDLDLVYAHESDDVLAWYENQTIHSSAFFPVENAFQAGGGEESVEAADLDGDGDLDFVVVNEDDETVVWLEDTSGDGSAYASAATIDSSATVAGTGNLAQAALALGDFDGDGDPDVLVGTDGDDRVVWHENRLSQSLPWADEILLDGASSDPRAAVAADLDGDGDLDAAVGFGGSGVRWYRNDAGVFAAGVDVDGTTDCRGLAAADIDGDGDLDLFALDNVLATSSPPFTVGWYENLNGDGTSWSAAQLITDTLTAPNGLAAGDFNGDGKPDVVVYSVGHLPETPEQALMWYTNQLPGSWDENQVDAHVASVFEVSVGDLDADGDADLWVGTTGGGRVYTYDPFTFLNWTRSFPGFGTSGVTIADVDRDGALDLVGALDEVHWRPNRGGALALTTNTTAAAGIVEGDEDDVLRIDALHRGQTFDSSVEIATLALRFEDGASNPLSSGQANALIENLRIYLDDGDGVFDPGDTPVGPVIGTLSLTAGVQTVTFTDGDPSVTHGPAGGASYFVVLELTATAAVQTPGQVEVFHVLDSGSTGEDAANDIPIAIELATEVSSGSVDALAGGDDEDGDGLTNAAEVLAGTDPFDTDSDADGLSDNDEGTHSSDPTLADSDGDGWLDGAEVALGTLPMGAGSEPSPIARAPFVDGPDVATGPLGSPVSVVAADLDGDGDLDVASAGNIERIDWHENTTGNATIWTARPISAALLAPQFVTVTDANRDGALDVLVASAGDDTVAVFMNEGGIAPAFSTMNVITEDPDGIGGIFEGYADGVSMARPGDFDSDGKEDVAIAASQQISFHQNNLGTGSSWVIRSTVSRDGGLAGFPADMDGDGNLDLMSIRFSSEFLGQSELSFLRNGGGGATAWTRFGISTASLFTWVEAADVDGDGDLDAISSALGLTAIGGHVDWWENTGNNADWTRHAVAVDLGGPASVTAADLDLDGDPDLVAALANSDSVVWFENLLGDGSVFSEGRVLANDAAGVAHAIAADIDGDGDLDVLAAVQNDDEIRWFENQMIHRSARFSGPTTFANLQTDAKTAVAEDIDGDGHLDAVVTFQTDDTVSWFANDGNGGFGSPQTVTAALDGALGVATGDLDGDGDPDVLASSNVSNQLVWYRNDGAGVFVLGELIDTFAGAAWGVTTADLDHDGDLDAVVAVLDEDEVSWYANDGLGVFTAGLGRQLVGAAPDARSVRVGDLNADGDLDVAAAAGNSFRWFAGDGIGGFGPAQTITPTSDVATEVRIADVNGDGHLDLVGALFRDDTVVWYANDTAGTILSMPNVITSTLADVWGLDVADLDGDGDPDVLAISVLTGGFYSYENDGTGGFAAGVSEDSAAAGSRAVAAADLDGDGDLDALVPRQAADAAGWYENRGGQLALPTVDDAYLGMVDGFTRPVLDIAATHRGRSADGDVELVTLELLLEEAPADPLSDAEANALFSLLAVHVDDGNGVFDGTPTDPILASVASFTLTAGVQTFSFTDADPQVQVLQGTPRTYFVSVTLQPGASGAPTTQFEISHLTESSSTGEDRTYDIPLTLEFAANTSSGAVQALSTVGDADSDGLSNLDEAATHLSDPLDVDTDDDGLDDGVEVGIGTIPINPDTDGDGLDDGVEVGLNFDPLLADTDGDGYCDGPLNPGAVCAFGPDDNCPGYSNASQTNSDPLFAGDLCQCGDVTGEGIVDATDLAQVRDHLVNGTPIGDRCNVIGPRDGGVTDCDVADAFVIDRYLQGGSGTVGNVCSAYAAP